MSIGPAVLLDKHCYVYCGPEHCNCKAGHQAHALYVNRYPGGVWSVSCLQTPLLEEIHAQQEPR